MAAKWFRFWDGSQIIEIPAETLNANHKLRVANGGVIYGIPLVDRNSPGALPIRMNIGTPTVPNIKAVGSLGYYELNYLARKYSSFGEASWYALVQNGSLISTDPYLIYSTTGGSWSPFPTKTENLRLNVDGERNVTGSDPRCGFKINYRVFETFKVQIQSKTWGDHGSLKLNRSDTFQRQDSTTILINGSPQTIAIGSYYQVQKVDWNPGDKGSGYSWLRVYNKAINYFDVNLEIWEYDEQFDSAYAKIDSYIEPAP